MGRWSDSGNRSGHCTKARGSDQSRTAQTDHTPQHHSLDYLVPTENVGTTDLPCAGSIGSMHRLGLFDGGVPLILPHNPHLDMIQLERVYEDALNKELPMFLENVLPEFDDIVQTALPDNLYRSDEHLNRVYKGGHGLKEQVSGFGREPEPFVPGLPFLEELEVDAPLSAHDQHLGDIDTYHVCKDAHGFDYQNYFGNVCEAAGEAVPPSPPLPLLPPVHSHQQHATNTSTRPLPPHHNAFIASTQPPAAVVPVVPVVPAKLETTQTSFSQYSMWTLFAYYQALLTRLG